MFKPRRQAVFGLQFARRLWWLIRLYWSSPDARGGALLLAGAICLELGTVYANLQLSDAERNIMDALQDKEPVAFLSAIGLFGAVSVAFALVSAYRIYLRQLLEIRWRRGVTSDYVARWMSEQAWSQAQLYRDEVDNPDQRVAEDIREFVASTLGLSLSFLAAVATLVSFGSLLWNLSSQWVFPLNSEGLRVPGLLLWVALLYAALSTWLTHVVGRRLVPLNVERLRYEADFRYGLMRFRDNAELVTLSRGETEERRGTLLRFRHVIENWWRLIAAQRRLTVFTGVIGQANGMVPLAVAAPSFFAGLITLGTVVQIRFAYGQVSGALNWFVFAYQEIARWRANVERLLTFADVMENTAQVIARSQIHVVPVAAPRLRISDVRLQQPDGRPLIAAANATVTAGDRVVITGPSGSGKTALLRAIAGAWPFGAGSIEVPAHARMLFVPQWPYLPIGSLRAAVSYPAPEGTFPDERIGEILRLLRLEYLIPQLDCTEPWDQRLSPHEQQRLAITRVLLNEPEWIFLDKATSSLDEETEEQVYRLIAARLPHTTLISVALAPRVAAHHVRRWTLEPKDHGPASLHAP